MQKVSIAIIGMGYVGLPLAVTFAKKYKVVGFDLSKKRIEALQTGRDDTLEVEENDLNKVLASKSDIVGLTVTHDLSAMGQCNVFIITVPTPIDEYKRPDLSALFKASNDVGSILKRGDIVIYESTVYPGVTEEECVPLLEQASGLQFNVDFFAGYSPERINPGDKEHTITKIIKITSGSTPDVADFVDELYGSIIDAGTFKANSIKIAEAAKVIENTQRDINIAFVNELSKIFNKLQIDTSQVLEAAATKWNFIKFKPGLVGGHCIGIDPYYLAQKAEQIGYHSEIILAGRRLNDGMGEYVAQQVIKMMIHKDIQVKNAKILILGITFKENCADVRNSKVIDVVNTLSDYGAVLSVYDPWANASEVEEIYNLKCLKVLNEDTYYDAVILAVAHNEFLKIDVKALCKSKNVVFDIKGFLPLHQVDGRL